MDSESAPPASPPTSTKKTLKQACDNCRRRKIKCNRAHPCDKCQRLLLSCSYSDVLQRKGPKFRTLYPLAPLHPLASQYQFQQSNNNSNDPAYNQKTQFSRKSICSFSHTVARDFLKSLESCMDTGTVI